jgi:hypothetical protein
MISRVSVSFIPSCAGADSSSGDAIFCSTANPVELVQKELSVTLISLIAVSTA